MPNLIIDEREIAVSEGTKVIEAAEQLGIFIPRFCYHRALGAVGACRVCGVNVLAGPMKGIQMSCMLDAQDGMVISTTDAEAEDFRRHVIEWLMLNHPHDCPVCDEGGHCLLQDMTVSGGHGLRRFRGDKRTHNDQHLGPLIAHEMNRCIQCYRCSRFYRQYCGYDDLGVMGIGSRVYFGRYRDGTLESPFAGNLIDICPTGVFTDKPSRYKGRRWDFERSGSLCINCSLGCNTVTNSRYRETVRQEARFSETVNGHFICDRGRFGFSYTNAEDRPRHARIDGKKSTLSDALQAAASGLGRIEKQAGAGAVACVGSVRSSLQTLAALQRLCLSNKWQGPICWSSENEARKVNTAVSNLHPDLAVSLHDLEGADHILILGADPLNEAPMAAVAIRQAQRNGGAVTVIDPRPVSLPCRFEHLALGRKEMTAAAALLMKTAFRGENAAALNNQARDYCARIPDASVSQETGLADAARGLATCKRPVIMCGSDIVPPALPEIAADFARLLKDAGKQAGLFYLLPAANTFGAGLLSPAGYSLEKIVTQIETGAVKAMLVVESNPLWTFPDSKRLETALKKLDLLVTLDYVYSSVVKTAHVSLPTQTLYEDGGIFINQEGRAQQAPPVFRGGIPISQVGGGVHPPRSYRRVIPGSDRTPAWEILGKIGGISSKTDACDDAAELMDWLRKEIPAFADLPSPAVLSEHGIRLHGTDAPAATFAHQWEGEGSSETQDDTFELVTVDWTFGTEELSVLSACLAQREKQPCMLIHAVQAAKLGFAQGDVVCIELDKTEVCVKVSLHENMAPGTLVLPRHHGLAWQNIGKKRIVLPTGRIRKTEQAA